MTEREAHIRQEILDIFNRLGINYVELFHSPVFTMADAESIAVKLNIVACKNLLLRNRQQQYFLVMMAGHKRLVAKDIARQIGSSHISFATEQEIEVLLNAGPGCISPLGLIFDTEKRIQLLIDKDILKLEYIGCHPSVNCCSIRMNTADLLNIFVPFTNHDCRVIELNRS